MQNTKLPTFQVSPAPENWNESIAFTPDSWKEIPALSPFILADGSRPAEQQTITQVCYDQHALYVRFHCHDDDIWGTYTERDQPIYDEEVVEIFLASGDKDPIRYYEFEVSPDGVLFDVEVYNPTSERSDIELNIAWNCNGIRWQAQRFDDDNYWWAVLIIPWAGLENFTPLPSVIRANFYRIERPRNREPEFSCWSPTMTQPADFHKPAYFGTLNLG